MVEAREKSRIGSILLSNKWRTLCALLFVILAVSYATHLYYRLKCRSFDFVNKDFVCMDQIISKSTYRLFENSLKKYFDERIAAGDITDVSVYFRDLRYGPIFGVNENLKFAPASLLKLPLAMAYFNIEETNPGILEEKITYTPDIVKQFVDLKQNEVPEETLVSGQSYGVEELLRRTIVDSDNASYYLLAAHIEKVQGGDASVFRVFQELGIIDPRNVSEEVSTVRNYASLFRLLYNVSYLSPEHSEELLGWLSEATYHKGLSAGVPAGVRVAHKFGERFLPNEKKQLHDCGIVYYPRNPYILCVMTKGDDWDKMTAIIREVSKMTYTEVDGRKISSFKR